MANENSSKRIFILSQRICGGSVGDLCGQILRLNAEDNDQESKLSNFTREPIHIYIDSFGGSAYDMWALIDVIESLNTPVYTYCVGSSMSAAFMIFLAGEKRFIGRHATLMYHQLSTWQTGKLQDILDNIDEAQRVQNSMEEYIKERTGLTDSELSEWRNSKIDVYFTPDDAVKRGIATDVLARAS